MLEGFVAKVESSDRVTRSNQCCTVFSTQWRFHLLFEIPDETQGVLQEIDQTDQTMHNEFPLEEKMVKNSDRSSQSLRDIRADTRAAFEHCRLHCFILSFLEMRRQRERQEHFMARCASTINTPLLLSPLFVNGGAKEKGSNKNKWKKTTGTRIKSPSVILLKVSELLSFRLVSMLYLIVWRICFNNDKDIFDIQNNKVDYLLRLINECLAKKSSPSSVFCQFHSTRVISYSRNDFYPRVCCCKATVGLFSSITGKEPSNLFFSFRSSRETIRWSDR